MPLGNANGGPAAVPLRWLTASELRPALLRSGGEAEHLVDEGPLRRHVVGGHGTHLSLRQHRHGLDAGEGSPSGPKALKAEHRPCSTLDPAVVLLDQVVEPPAERTLEEALAAFLSRLALSRKSTVCPVPSTAR